MSRTEQELGLALVVREQQLMELQEKLGQAQRENDRLRSLDRRNEQELSRRLECIEGIQRHIQDDAMSAQIEAEHAARDRREEARRQRSYYR